MLDHIDYDLSNHLADQAKSEALDDAVTEHSADLLENDYSPEDPINVLEALGEIDLTVLVPMLSDMPQSGRLESLLRGLIVGYWTKLARNQAAVDISKNHK